jgi:quinol monooxygenase YgiN
MIVILARFRIRDGKQSEALEAVHTMTERVHGSEPDCLVYLCHRSLAEPSEIVWYEVYQNDAALAAHGGSEHMKAFGQRLPDIVDVAQIKVERLERVEGFVRESFPKAT